MTKFWKMRFVMSWNLFQPFGSFIYKCFYIYIFFFLNVPQIHVHCDALICDTSSNADGACRGQCSTPDLNNFRYPGIKRGISFWGFLNQNKLNIVLIFLFFFFFRTKKHRLNISQMALQWTDPSIKLWVRTLNKCFLIQSSFLSCELKHVNVQLQIVVSNFVFVQDTFYIEKSHSTPHCFKFM